MARRNLILDRYRPLGKAGEGGFSTVIAAFDTHLKRNVAIKVIELDEETARRLAYSMGIAAADPPEPVSKRDNRQTASQEAWLDEVLSAGENPFDEIDRESDFDYDYDDPREDPFDEMGSERSYPDDPAFLDETELDLSSEGLANLPGATPSRLITHEGAAAPSTLPGLSEAQVAGNLGSPNIVAVYDLQLEGTTAYLIMEYVDGTSLADLLADHDDDLTLDIIAAIADGVANALEVAHRNNVLHLDIKPGNILIDKQGQVKVTDFGMAAIPDAQGDRHGEGGTIGYMPPEQMNRENLDERCDEWALASVIYEMLAGENPFIAPDLTSAQDRIRNAELVVPSLMWEDLDDQADDVLFYALDPDRDERYETVNDFAEEIIPLIGKPKRGQKELAELLSPQEEEDEDEPEEEREPIPHIPLRDRLTPTLSNIVSRVFAFLGTAAIMATGMANMPQNSTVAALVMWILVIVGAGAAAALPCLGPLFAFTTLTVALLLNGTLAPALTLIVATVAWWAFATTPRRAKAAANIGLALPFCSGFALAPLASLASGYYLTVGKAAATAAFTFVTAVVLGGLGARSLISWNPLEHLFFASSSISVNDSFIFLLTQPGTWAIGASWILAAVVFSLCCSRGHRWLAALGAVGSGVVLATGLVVARLLATGGAELAPTPLALGGAIVSALVALVCCCVVIPEDASVYYGKA